MISWAGRLLQKASKKGLRGCLRAIACRLPRPAAGAGRLAALAASALGALGVRLVVNSTYPLNWTRIGHLATEPDCYVKERRLGLHRHRLPVLFVPRGQVANPCLLDYWRRHFCVVTSPLACRLLGRLAAFPAIRHPVDGYMTAMHVSATYPEIQTAYRGRPPVLLLRGPHRAAGEARLRELGVPPGAWFVCVHCRESGFAPRDTFQRFRDADIFNYLAAVRAIVERGGWCVRMGDPTMKPLPPAPGLIDYAHSPLRADWMDIFLCAACKFFLGCGSGLAPVATAFGVPCAITNQVPLATLPYGSEDVGIPKLFWCSRRRRYLTFPEVMRGPLANARFAHCYEEAGVAVVENTPEDIRDLALEVLARVEGTAVYTADDERRQRAFKALLRPGDYAYGAVARVGAAFLRKHEALLEPGEAGRIEWPGPRGCGTPECDCFADWMGWVSRPPRPVECPPWPAAA
ncbi:MAG TPA: TIGR04372 family glycosyltransferase [Gemmataceae bacterium]|nr:TIGR04372 family glycosyltransferase [Gemmataceae bacterium]